MTITPRRSVLYMPASNLRAIEKAKTLAADCIILDLEDAVSPDLKQEARINAVNAVSIGGFGTREVIIRANGLDTPWGHDDIKAIGASKTHAILIPKINTASDCDEVESLLNNSKMPIWAMMETAKAMLGAQEITTTKANLTCFVMGLNDLAKETKVRQVAGRAPMLPWMMHCLTVARAANLSIIDGVFNAISDEEGFQNECYQARDCGFDGKTLIHPSQINACNNAFSPTQEEIEHAKAVIAAFALPQNKGKAALNINGKMTEILHAQMAKELVALAEIISAR